MHLANFLITQAALRRLDTGHALSLQTIDGLMLHEFALLCILRLRHQLLDALELLQLALLLQRQMQLSHFFYANLGLTAIYFWRRAPSDINL